MYKYILVTLISVSLLSCTKKTEPVGSVDDTPVQSKVFEISGVKVGYAQFDSYLCFQLVGGLFMVKNQYYTQKLAKASSEDEKVRTQRLMDRTVKARTLMESKAKEIVEMRKASEGTYEDQAKKSVEMLVEAHDTLKLFEPDILKLCGTEAKVVKAQCFKVKDQAAFSKCYDEKGKALNKKVLTYFNSNYAT